MAKQRGRAEEHPEMISNGRDPTLTLIGPDIFYMLLLQQQGLQVIYHLGSNVFEPKIYYMGVITLFAIT